MLTKNHFDIADPKQYSSGETMYRYFILYDFEGVARPRKNFNSLTRGTVTISRPKKIQSLDDLREIEEVITKFLKKQWNWNNARLMVTAFSRFEDD